LLTVSTPYLFLRMNKYFSFFILIILLICGLNVNAQIQKIDSLSKVIEGFKNQNNYQKDTTYLNLINEKAGLYNSVNTDSSINIVKLNIETCKKAKYEKGQAEAIRILAMGLGAKGEYLEAIKYYNEALVVAQNVNAEKVISKVYNGLGIVFKNLGDFVKALDFHFKSLAIKEKLNDWKAITNSLGNIAIIYKNIGEYKEALVKYEQSLAIFKSIKDKQGIATSLNNISSIYSIQKKYSESIKFNMEALAIQNKISDNTGKAFSYEQIGISHLNLKKYTEAINNFNQSLKIKEFLGDKNGIAVTYRFLASTYTETKEYQKALAIISKSLSISLSIRNKMQISNAYNKLYEIYKDLNNTNLALSALENRIIYDDSLRNVETEKKIVQLRTKYEFENKEKLLIAEQEQKNLINEEKLKKQQLGLWFTLFAIVIAVVLIIFILRSRIKLKEAYQNLEKANNEIKALNDGLNEKVKERTETLERANQKLKKFSFTNNHVIRKPIANILSIIRLFNTQQIDDPVNITSLELLQLTTNELDEIIHEINKNLENETQTNP